MLRKLIGQSLRQRAGKLLGTLTEPQTGKGGIGLKGALNLAFAVGQEYLFLDGWMAAPATQITDVTVIDKDEIPAAADFELFTLHRADVESALRGKLAPGFACFGYRMLIRYEAKRS